MAGERNELLDTFDDPESVARYVQGPPRHVPGFADLHKMATILLTERAPARARVLVLGAGGGLELKAFADVCPGWTFDGVDPAPAMLDLARKILGPLASRVRLHQGEIDAAPPGPFHAAACLLTLHFLDPDARQRAAAEVRRRLRPGAPFVVAHSSFPQEARALWLSRFEAFAVASGVPREQARESHDAITRSLRTLAPEEDEAILRQAGFSGVSLFYAAFTWRGWVAYA